MSFQSVDEILAATASVGRVEGDTFVPSGGAVDGALVDRLAHAGALGATPEIRGTARWIIRSAGGRPGHPARVDPRPLHGHGPRRGRRLHRARR